MTWLTHSQTGFQQAARYLLGMRLAIIALQLVALAVAETVIALTHRAEALMLCLLYGVVATLCWLWFTRHPPKSAISVSGGFAMDLVLIGLWLFLTGGYTNPLVSLLLLPIAVAIILVPPRHSVALTLSGIAVYTALVIWHAPISQHDHNNASLAKLHLAGMWVTFALTACILLMVVGALAQRLRQQQAQLSSIRETRLRDEQIIALGLSAAAVAHRLGTPLNTMTLLVDEVRSAHPDPELAQDLSLMEQQLELCSDHLRQLTKAAVQAKTAQLESLSAHAWLARLRDSATLLWPAAPIDWPEAVPDCRVAVDATLDQAILNLLANALTASPAWVAVSVCGAEAGRIEIVVEDHGGGMEAAQIVNPGAQVVGSENGLGVGLFLSNATIQRLGGNLRARVDHQGTTMIIDLPEASAGAAAMGDNP